MGGVALVAQDADYLVALELLNRPHGRERSRMYRSLRTLDDRAIDAAIDSLAQDYVLVVKGRCVVASAALRRLERINLIGV